MKEVLERLVNKINSDFNNFEEVFISIGHPNIKAYVKYIKNTEEITKQLLKQINQYQKKTSAIPKWIKIDVVTNKKVITFNELEKKLIDTRRNYVEFGFSLDDQWELSFLPDEINANAFVRPSKQDKNILEIAENNVTHYLKKFKKLNKKFKVANYKNKNVIVFRTKGYFIEEGQFIELNENKEMKGIRKVDNLNIEIDKLIKTSSQYLQNEILPNGKYRYGRFPHFDREINYYNVLRHSSSTYSLIESLVYLNKDIAIATKPLNYIIDHCYYEKNNEGYIFDDTNSINEIKLGQNAAFVFAICEYLKTNPNDDKYLEYAQKVAQGILAMINKNNMETIHVLNYPDLSIKEHFRVVYYDGEAALALLRLYQIDNNPQWLETVEILFEKFINEKYWKYHDHWLGYCTNELVKIIPKEKYFKFGLENIAHYLDYIYHRETAFPTFLELLMATYHLVEKAKKNGCESLVNDILDEEKFMNTIHKRADYQRTGYFYPEIAMYFKNPKSVLGSFFIKHHGYRVRIDDIEHYLSGYIQYQKVFKSGTNKVLHIEL